MTMCHFECLHSLCVGVFSLKCFLIQDHSLSEKSWAWSLNCSMVLKRLKQRLLHYIWHFRVSRHKFITKIICHKSVARVWNETWFSFWSLTVWLIFSHFIFDQIYIETSKKKKKERKIVFKKIKFKLSLYVICFRLK